MGDEANFEKAADSAINMVSCIEKTLQILNVCYVKKRYTTHHKIDNALIRLAGVISDIEEFKQYEKERNDKQPRKRI